MPGVTPVLAAAAALGTVSVLARDAYASGSEPVSLLGARLLVAAVVLTPFALRERPGRAAGPGRRLRSPGSRSRAPGWASSRRCRERRRRRWC